MHKSIEDLRKRFGASEGGRYFVCDTIGVPHPYCVGPKHIVYAADHHCGILGAAAIEAAEKAGVASCCICHGKLAYREHETALLIECNGPLHSDTDPSKAHPELHAYLLACKEKFTPADKYVGFAFKKGEG